MYLVDFTFVKPLEKIDRHVAAHREHLAQHYANSNLLFAGRKIPRTGGIILSCHRSREEVESVFNPDSMVNAGAITYSVIEFQPVMMRKDLEGLM